MRVDGTVASEGGNCLPTAQIKNGAECELRPLSVSERAALQARLRPRLETFSPRKKIRTHRNSKSYWHPESQTVSEIGRLIVHRYGGPCNKEGKDIYLRAVLPSLIYIIGGINVDNLQQRVEEWVAERTPRLDKKIIKATIAEAIVRNKENHLWWNAQELGNILRLQVSEREQIHITRIRQAGATQESFIAYQRKRKALRAKIERAARGAQSHERSAAKLKPWEAYSISRASYYRKSKKGELPVHRGDRETNSWRPDINLLKDVTEESHVDQPVVPGGLRKGAPSLSVADGLSPGDQTKAVPNDHTRAPPLPREDIHEQRDLFGGLGDWRQLDAPLSAYKGGVLPPDLARVVREELRARLLIQDALAKQIGISRPHLANSLGGRSSLSRASAANLVKWLTREPPAQT